MTRSEKGTVERFCNENGYRYRSSWTNSPLSGVLFRSPKRVFFTEVVDAATARPPFLLGRAQVGRSRRRQVTVLVMPLRRPVPNMVLKNKKSSLLPGLNIALQESQKLSLEGDFNSYFSLYCPDGYERDALNIFMPDVMERVVDATAFHDVEFVDNRLLLYAPVDAFKTSGQLSKATELVSFLAEKVKAQTMFYSDLDRASAAALDPFRRAQMTSTGSGNHAIGDRGRRVESMKTFRMKIGVGFVSLIALFSAVYWVGMLVQAFTQ